MPISSELDDFLAAIESLKPARIAGCGGLRTRHDAMVAAERGADYVMFGEPADDRRLAFDAIIERIGWWAEVFQIPCVGFAASLDEVEPLAAAGADFVAIGDFGLATIRAAAQPPREAAARTHRRLGARSHDCGSPSPIVAAVLRLHTDARRGAAAQVRQCRSPSRNNRRRRRLRRPAPRTSADLAFGAFQRGFYLTAFREATKRVEQKNDPKAMTLLGELYADGSACRNDDKKAAEWYRLAAERGDREAMFALAHVPHGGPRRSARPRGGGARCSPPPPSSAMPPRPTTSRCSTSKASCSRRISRAPPNCSALRPRPATRRRNTRSRPSTRKAAACRRTVREAARLLGAAALAGNTDAEVEYGIALFNGTGVAKNESAAATYLHARRPQGQPDRAEPARLHVRDRPRREGRSGPGRHAGT